MEKGQRIHAAGCEAQQRQTDVPRVDVFLGESTSAMFAVPTPSTGAARDARNSPEAFPRLFNQYNRRERKGIRLRLRPDQSLAGRIGAQNQIIVAGGRGQPIGFMFGAWAVFLEIEVKDPSGLRLSVCCRSQVNSAQSDWYRVIVRGVIQGQRPETRLDKSGSTLKVTL